MCVLPKAVQPQHQLLSMNIDGEQCVCVDMRSSEVVFEAAATRYHTNHWIKVGEKPYLSLLTAKHVVKFYEVNPVYDSFEEDESLRITLSEDDEVGYCEFDGKQEHIFLVKNGKVLEKRSVRDNQTVRSMTLQQGVYVSYGFAKHLSISNDGQYCAIAAGMDRTFWWLIDIENEEQFKIES